MSNGEKLVEVYRATGEAEAQVIKGLLESSGIPCLLTGEAVRNIYGLTVDGLGEVIERHDDARSVRFSIEAPAALARYIAHKGSITVDGTSLTVNAVDGARFELNIVPHTLQETIMGTYQPGTRVNLEVDLLARYLERLLLGEGHPEVPRIHRRARIDLVGGQVADHLVAEEVQVDAVCAATGEPAAQLLDVVAHHFVEVATGNREVEDVVGVSHGRAPE